jgi:oligopeptide/dipeptide ABC transporter ATP-binding protein
MRQYPHQLSGGMCQRVMIAMALACRPRLLIADEPTTALDVTIQAQILGLLLSLRAEFGMSVLLVTHDMGVAAEVADRIVVMYAGRVVEDGVPTEVFRQPYHPYSAGLLACIPRLSGELAAVLPAIPGNMPEPRTPPPGCAFHPRCPMAVDRCTSEDPPLTPVASRRVACWRADEMARLTPEPDAAP